MNWARPPFERCIDYIHEADRLLYLCIQGLSHVSRMPALAKALADLDDASADAPLGPEKQRDLDEIDACARFAQEEIDKKFPVLHAHTSIALWAALEALVEDLAMAWLLNEPDVLSHDQFARLRVTLAEYERLDKQDRMSFLVKELARSTNADFKLGIGRFEVLLEPLGLAGAIDDDVKRMLFELSQVRNVLVHRAGIVDRRFKEACPWIHVEIGSKLRIDHESYVRYYSAVYDYILCLINRDRKSVV